MKQREGFILMAALWLLVALSAVGLDAALQHRAHRLAAANLLDETRMNAAADAGLEYARSRLTSAMLGRADELRAEASKAARTQQVSVRAAASFTTGRAATTSRTSTSAMSSMFRTSDPGSDPWRDPSGLMPPQLDWNGVTTTLVLRDPAAAINLNVADATMLQQFFSLGLHVDYALANKLAAAIMDWRDDDDIPQVNGGEREQYMHDGAAVLPANHAFGSVDELRFVMGMTDAIFSEARPYLRVSLTASAQINVNSAPEPVLLAIPGMNEEGATAILRQRGAGNYPLNIQQLSAILPSSTLSSMTALAGPAGLAALSRRMKFTTDEVEVIADASVPGNPARATNQIIVDRAMNGASVTWRRVQ